MVRGKVGIWALIDAKKCENSPWAISNQKNLTETKKIYLIFSWTYLYKGSINALCSCTIGPLFPEFYVKKKALCEKSMKCFYKCMEFEQKEKGV